jgi:hypothetical protein
MYWSGQNKFQKSERFSAPEMLSLSATKMYPITTFSPQIYHPKSPHFSQTAFKKLNQTIHIRPVQPKRNISRKFP